MARSGKRRSRDRSPALRDAIQDSAPGTERILVLRLRAARRKARAAALAEVLAVLRSLDARAIPGGPLADMPGVAWVAVSESHLEGALARLRGLGYTAAIDLVTSLEAVEPRGKLPVVRWKGRDVALVRVYEEPDEKLRTEAPDRRTFVLEGRSGVVRSVAGYRGGRGLLEHRALPVIDARLLVNLAASESAGVLLDPFAGAGGIVIAANAKGFTTVSLDRDPALRFGLAALTARHLVGDAASLPFAPASFDAVASEPPYHPQARETVVAAIAEITRVTRRGGRIALLAASDQAAALREAGACAGLTVELDVPIDRKGTAVTCLCFVR